MTFSATVLVGDFWQLSGRPSPIRANRLQHRDDLSFDLPVPQAQGSTSSPHFEVPRGRSRGFEFVEMVEPATA